MALIVADDSLALGVCMAVLHGAAAVASIITITPKVPAMPWSQLALAPLLIQHHVLHFLQQIVAPAVVCGCLVAVDVGQATGPFTTATTSVWRLTDLVALLHCKHSEHGLHGIAVVHVVISPFAVVCTLLSFFQRQGQEVHSVHSVSRHVNRKSCLVEKHGISHISKVCLILESGVVMVKGQFSRWSLVWRSLVVVMCLHSSHLQRTVNWSGIWRPRLARMGFFWGVGSVKDSDDNFFRNCFVDVNKVLCYQRAEDVRTRRVVTVVVPTNDREIPGSTPGRYNLQIKITSTS